MVGIGGSATPLPVGWHRRCTPGDVTSLSVLLRGPREGLRWTERWHESLGIAGCGRSISGYRSAVGWKADRLDLHSLRFIRLFYFIFIFFFRKMDLCQSRFTKAMRLKNGLPFSRSIYSRITLSPPGASRSSPGLSTSPLSIGPARSPSSSYSRPFRCDLTKHT